MSDKKSNKLLSLVSQVGSNAYAAYENGDGTVNLEMTPAQASKLEKMVGKENAAFVSLAGTHLVYRFSLAALEKAAKENQKVAAGSSIPVEIVSRMVYAIDAPQAKNVFAGAWWEAESKTGGITINGVEHEIFAGKAEDYYAEPEDTAKAAEWNPERTVYVVKLPTADGDLVISSYGITNLIRSVCRRNVIIG